ncbi:MAG TPA: T9SS type A sorting domain-containing protein [Chitinophagaceae bacterium]|jgi:hypothetical protein
MRTFITRLSAVILSISFLSTAKAQNTTETFDTYWSTDQTFGPNPATYGPFVYSSDGNLETLTGPNALDIGSANLGSFLDIKETGGATFEFVNFIADLDQGTWPTGLTVNVTGYRSGVAVTSAIPEHVVGNPTLFDFSSTAGFKNVDEVKITGTLQNVFLEDWTYNLVALLPVAWLDFNVTQQNDIYRWNWSMGTELNVAYYVPQYSTDGSQFIDAGKIATLRSEHSYQFSKYLSLPDKIFFRVKEVDIDGNISYSSIRSLAKSTAVGSLIVYPNPAMAQVQLQWPYNDAESLAITIFNSNGQIVQQQYNAIADPVKIDLSHLPAGIYFISSQDDKNRELISHIIKSR